jgi:hypothetical protein
MAALRELQEGFRAAILGGAETAVLPLVLANGLSPAQRLQVHRNNVLSSLAAALEATFPVVARLVGEGFFRAAAQAFVRAEPPRRPCLAEYGGGFAAFLARFAPAQALPYLPDVARLEWAVNECQQTADSPALATQSLAGLPEAEVGSLRLKLHPAWRLIESPFPVDRIWLANQPRADGEAVIDLDVGGCRLLVGRDGDGAVLHALEPPAFAFVNHVADGKALTAAYEGATSEHGDFDLAALLARLFRAGALARADATRVV